MRPDKIHIIIIFLFYAFAIDAQKDAKYIYDGNEMYRSGKIPQSLEYYRYALKINPDNSKAHFNIGNTLYKNGLAIKASKENFVQGGKKVTPDSLAGLVFDEAAQSFAKVANSVSDKDTLHRAWHNIGNCYLQKKDYQQAIDAYKKSLKFNSKDEETRYNLAYALKHLPKDKKGGGSGGGNDPKKQQDKKEQQSKNAMTKDQADQLLKALMKDEKKLQDKRKQKQEDPANTTIDKDW